MRRRHDEVGRIDGGEAWEGNADEGLTRAQVDLKKEELQESARIERPFPVAMRIGQELVEDAGVRRGKRRNWGEGECIVLNFRDRDRDIRRGRLRPLCSRRGRRHTEQQGRRRSRDQHPFHPDRPPVRPSIRGYVESFADPDGCGARFPSPLV